MNFLKFRFAHTVQTLIASGRLFLLIYFSFLSCEHEYSIYNSSVPWPTSSPEAQGMNGRILSDLTGRLRDGAHGEIHSLLIIRNGYLVVEEYFRGYNQARLHPVYSVTKSVTSALVGIAMDQGKLNSLDEKLLSFFPEYPAVANLNDNKQAMSLVDVLTMRAGFDWNEGSTPYGDPRNPTYQLVTSPDWIKFMLDLRMIVAPGTSFRYNSGCTMLFSGVIRNTTGMSTAEFARINLFEPLAIDNIQWETGPHGLTNTGWGLHLRPLDMAKIGYLYLKNGAWEDRQIISANWVSTSTVHHVILSQPFGYGYQWWLMPLENVPGHTPQPDDIKIAWGYGDQFIFVISALNMVVVSTAGNFSGPIQDQAIDFVMRYVVKSVRIINN